MKFKNETEKNQKYRIGTPNNYLWKTIRPGEIRDIPEHIGDAFKLTKVEEPKEIIEDELVLEDVKKVDAKVNPKKADVKVDAGFLKKEYQKKLIAIKGVGKKSAEDIIKDYPTEKLLIKAVKKGEEVHNNDGVDRVVKKKFKE